MASIAYWLAGFMGGKAMVIHNEDVLWCEWLADHTVPTTEDGEAFCSRLYVESRSA